MSWRFVPHCISPPGYEFASIQRSTGGRGYLSFLKMTWDGVVLDSCCRVRSFIDLLPVFAPILDILFKWQSHCYIRSKLKPNIIVLIKVCKTDGFLLVCAQIRCMQKRRRTKAWSESACVERSTVTDWSMPVVTSNNMISLSPPLWTWMKVSFMMKLDVCWKQSVVWTNLGEMITVVDAISRERKWTSGFPSFLLHQVAKFVVKSPAKITSSTKNTVHTRRENPKSNSSFASRQL